MKLPVWYPLYGFLKLCGLPVVWEKSVGAILFRVRNGVREYLLLRYPSGHYEFPRGHVEGSETEEETLRREVMEETGIADIETIYPLRLLNKFYYTAGVEEAARRRKEGRGTMIFKRTYMFPARTTSVKTTLSHEHTDFLWLPYPQALNKVTYSNAKQLLQQTESWLKTRKEQ